MNKTELVAAMAEQAGLSKKDAEKALKAFTDVVGHGLIAVCLDDQLMNAVLQINRRGRVRFLPIYIQSRRRGFQSKDNGTVL